jgi:TRAP-type C4-dicarboxylate transport system permease small subunit
VDEAFCKWRRPPVIQRNRPMFRKILNVIDIILTIFEEWTLFITVMMALLALFVNVVLRYGFNYTLNWSEELVREVIVYTTFIGCGAAVKNRSMIKIDALVQLVPKLKIPLTYFSNLVVLVFSLIMIYFGWKLVQMGAESNLKTIIMRIPYAALYFILPLTGVTMFIRTIQVMRQDIHDHFFAPADSDGATK